MKQNGQTNIIFDDDITITTGKDVGKKLSEVLSKQSEAIEGMASNVKWLYKYGGIGSGGGGGGGSTTSWTAQVTRVDTGDILKDNVTANFGKEGTYSIRVQIYNGGTSTFKITYAYTNSRGSQTKSEIVWSEQGFTSQQPLYLDTNGKLNITILNQDTQVVIQYVIPYIVTAYNFSIGYVYSDTLTPAVFNNNTIFMNDVKNRGIKVLFTSNVSVELSYSSYTYVDWNGEPHTVGMHEGKSIESETNKKIYLDLIPDEEGDNPGDGIKRFLSNNNNAKFKQFLLDIDIQLKGNTSHEDIDELSLKDNLIPSDMFLKVTVSGGTIYETEQTTYPESGQFVLGAIPFNLTPYDGAYDPNKRYDLYVYDAIKQEDIWVETPVNVGISQLSDQTEQTVIVQINTSGEHRIRFVITRGTSYSVEYYFYVKELSSEFTWYEENESGVPTKGIFSQAYYRNYLSDGILNVSGIDASTPIEMTMNSQAVSYQFTCARPNSLNGYDQFINVGFQYSEINDTSLPIFSIDVDPNEEQGRIFVYQNKVLVATNSSIEEPSGDTVEIFYPFTSSLSQTEKTNYHLLSIYKRYGLYDSGSYYKTISVYLDGVLEGVFQSMATVHKNYSGITFYPGNYFCNLFEYTVVSHNKNEDDIYYNEFEVEPDPSIERVSAPFLTDNDIVFYYFTYKEKMLNIGITENEKFLYDLFNNLDVREDRDNFVHTNQTTIGNVAENSEIPVIVINSVDTEGRIGGFQGYNQDNFKLWMSATYNENSSIDTIPVTIEWKGVEDSQLRVITKQGEQAAANFSVTLQGSSTLGYRCKNFELFAPASSREGYDCIFSPNFIPITDGMTEEAQKEAYNSFLPEASFTLKADVVDSSHTNNNAIGKFVNTITTPFERAKQNGSIYSSYIKNCLTGFPILVFLHTSYKADASSSEYISQFYFLGIYNFNLGRGSYFNLGYKNVYNLENIEGGLKNGFNIYEIPDSQNGLLPGVVVGEIQGNNNFFDFSQSHETILFSQGSNDLTYMFGDFVDGSGSDASIAKRRIREFVKKVSLAGGYVFTEIEKHFSNTDTDNYGYDEGYSGVDEFGVSLNQVPSYQYEATRTQIGSDPRYSFEPLSDLGTRKSLLDLLIYDEITGNEPALDYASLCEYYTTCMAFGLVDSVQKNLNIKSWNGSTTSTYPLFYVAFYDMDTCLGVSNSGSRIDYFAFSDYWQSKLEEGVLQSTEVYRDFSPKNTEGEESYGSFFDVPSSYLFAVAKYGYFVKNGMNEGGLDDPLYYHPSNLWAIWRKKNTIPYPQNQIEKETGCLANSKKFMENYYNKHLDGTPYSAFNYNYRYKYLVKTPDKKAFDDTNFEKFYGRKIAYTENWLDGRFHLLDAYFNLNSIPDVIVENKYYAPYASNNLVDSTNDDIYVLKDIFSTTSNGNQYAQLNTSVTVKSRPYAPLIMRSSNAASRYIFPKDNDPCIINLRTSGNQYLLYGGSSLWTELNTINPFITSNKTLTVRSKYFTNLVGNNSAQCSSWQLSTPSLKTISLTGSNYSGDLKFESTGGSVEYPNLTSITISGTNIKLSVNNAYVETINALNMKSSSVVNISNVTTLKPNNVNINGNMSSLNIPAWQRDIYFPTNYPTNHNAVLNCASITVTNNVSLYPNNRLYVYNNDTLTQLTVTGFSEVYVEKCPKLSKIIINDTSVLTKLTVIMPEVSTHTVFAINSNENGVVDLGNQTQLSYVKFNYCKMKKVIMPPINNMELVPKAFLGCGELEYFVGSGNSVYYIQGTESNTPDTFMNCYKFTLKQSANPNDISPIYVPASTTSLYRVFYMNDLNKRGSVNLNTASKFLKEHCDNAYNVTSISQMFFNQNIEYNKSTLLSEYNQGTCSLSLSKFPRVTSAERTFLGNKISGYNRYMFKGLGQSSNSLTITNIIGEYSSRDENDGENERWQSIGSSNYHVLYATKDFLYEVLDRITSFAARGYSYDNSYLYFINPSSNFITHIQIGNEIFRKDNEGTYVYPIKLTSLTQWEMFPSHHINMENMFWYQSNPREGWLAAGENGISISSFFYYGSSAYKYFSNINNLLKYIKIKSVTTLLNGFSNGTDGDNRIDMYEFINWNGIDGATNLFYSEYASLGFYKYISYDNFKTVWYKILSSNSLTSVGYLFRNCIITVSDTPVPFVLTNENIVNTKITNTYHLFNNCHLSRTLVDSTNPNPPYLPMNIYHSFFSCLPNLINVPCLFANTLWANPIPFDFFNKRIEETQNVYVGETRKEAVLYTYSYNNNMIDMYMAFKDVTFNTACQAFRSNDSCNEGSFLANRAVDENDNVYYQYYLSTEPDATLYTIEQNTEITDAWAAETPNISEYINSVDSIDIHHYRFTNFSAYFSTVNNTTGCFVTPDIFYGISEGGTSRNIEYSLGITTGTPDAKTMSGLIPANLLKNVKTISPRGILTNLNILPWYIDEYETEEDNQTVTYKCFCYVPSNFTLYSNLSEMFDFHLILPYTTQSQRSIYYVLHNDSIPSNATSLSNGLPGATADNNRSSLIGQDAGYPNTAANDVGIRYNIMLEEHYVEIESAWEYQVNSSPIDTSLYETVLVIPTPTIDSPMHIKIDESGTMIYYDKVATAYRTVFDPIEGIDMNKFTYLKLDNLISVPLSFFLSGNLFKDGTLPTSSWSSRKYMANYTINYVVRIGYSTTAFNGLSRMARLPLTVTNDRFIYNNVGGDKVQICKNSVEGGYTDDYQNLGGYPNITFID